MLESTVTSKGQTTLPKDVRKFLGVDTGDRVRYLIIGNEVRLLKPRKIMSLSGSLKHDGSPVTLEDMDAVVRSVAAERHSG